MLLVSAIFPFKLCAQTITNFSPTSGPVGTTITITGTGFNASGPNDVYFGPIKVTANANAPGTSIVVNVPAGASSVTPIIVRNVSTQLQANSLNASTPFFTITHSPALNITTGSFTKSSYAGTSPFVLASGDFDNDGFADIATTNNSGTTIELHKNNGLGQFSTSFPALNLTGSASGFNIKTGDLDGDGNLDLAVAKSAGADLDLFKGNGDGTFTPFPTLAGVTGGGAGLALADINNDGHLDILSSAYGTLNILIGDGTGNFVHGPNSPFALAAAGSVNISLADIDNDGYIDLSIPDSGTNLVYVLLNNQNETFTIQGNYAVAATPVEGVSGYFDGDANIDLAILSYGGGGTITLLKGDGAGAFTPFTGSPVSVGGSTPLGLSQGDFDGDGITDLVVGGNSANNVPLYKGDGAGGFSLFPTFPFDVGTAQPYGITSSDFNNDGVADIAYANSGTSSLDVLLSIRSFITTWSTTDGQITIPTNSPTYTYNYDIVWTNLTNAGVGDGSATGQTGDFPIPGLENGSTYQIKITGVFPQIYFNNTGDKDKILTIEQWGDMVWSSMRYAFYGCTNLTSSASDAPNLSAVTNINKVFAGASNFNGPIGNWDVSNVTSMESAFSDASSFNQDISSWNVGNVTSMYNIFRNASAFDQNINNWNVSNVINMSAAFTGASSFNQPLNNWSVGNVLQMASMFNGATAFNQDLSSWTVGNVTNMQFMFFGASSFNGDITSWATGSVTNMRAMFGGASSFNQDIGGWSVGAVTDMDGMFQNASTFNQNLNNWNVDMVTDMGFMFYNATAFNGNIAGWNVGMVTNMQAMFSGASSFNQNISGWTTGNVTNMSRLFSGGTSFDQDISGWTVGAVTDMRQIFFNASSFNQDINGWDVANVTDLYQAFTGATSFDQPLGGWDVGNVTTMFSMLNSTALSTANYDATLIGWQSLPSLQNGVDLGASGLTYCFGEAARAALMATHSWTFTGDSKNCPPGPEIALYEGTDNTGTAIPSGQVVPVHFSHLKLGQDKDIVFAIENTGTAALTINSITLTGTDFTILSPPTSVTPGATENFTVRLSGATKGIYNAFVSIDNDDVDESTYWFSVTGTVGQLDPKVYWTDDLTFPTEDQINRSDLDGNNFQQYYSGFEPKISGIAVDTTNNMLFWTSASKATIRCARMDEGGFTTYGTILDESGGSSRPFNGLDIDAAAQKIYFTSEWTNEIRRINFDGTGSEVLVSINGPKDIALDVAGGKMYYVVLNLSTPELWRADLDGSNQQLLHSSGTTLFLGVALDLVNGHVYWTESAGGIERSDLDGSNLTFVGTANSPGGIALNVGEQKIYYVDTSTPAIRRVNFDGTGDVAIQSGTNVFNPVHIDIDPRFPPVVGPEINVFAGNDNTGTPITDGQATPIDLGNAVQGNDLVQTFAIENTGTADLNVSSITASGSDYSVASTIATVAAGATETFTVTLSGANAGTFNTSLDIASDDADENPFTFDITGTISQPCLPITAGTPSVQSTINVPSNVDVVAASTINNGDIITVSILQAPSKGSAIILADNTIGYTAQEGTVGADSFPYRICNQCGLCSDGTITVDIQNEPPVFAPPAVPVEVVAGQTITIDLATLFSDLNGNLDLASFSGFSSSWSASPSYDGATGTLVLDYANATPAGPSDEVGFTLCDQLGACTQATLSIAIDGSITAYNGISPNGDGINDYFILKNIQFLEPENKVNIYNRWGDKVFEMEGYNPDIPEKRFNGISDKGKALPSGVYFYKVEFSSGREDLTGYLTIKR